MKTLDTDALVTATGGLAIPPSTGPTFPRPPTFPLPWPQDPSPTFPRPRPFPGPIGDPLPLNVASK